MSARKSQTQFTSFMYLEVDRTDSVVLLDKPKQALKGVDGLQMAHHISFLCVGLLSYVIPLKKHVEKHICTHTNMLFSIISFLLIS